MEMKVSYYNDIWMDNAVENLYHLIGDSEGEFDINLEEDVKIRLF